MGKYTRKAKVTLDVAVMDVSQSYLGVRTRAKTLALQRLQSVAAAAVAPAPAKPDACYLELRSRRLEKPMQLQTSRNVRHGCGCEEELEIEGRAECSRPSLIPGSIEGEGLGNEASFGENSLDFEDRGRGTRESTPCSLIRAPDTIITPGSTTKKTCSSAPSQRIRSALLINVPSECDLEEFFAREEHSVQQHFKEKYNFDFMNDSPLPGRYEWVAVRP
ncbi:hypothetical protein CDL12_04528 [Handroanthus impetiginosus]|uniref:Cyclin-dependent kinase inhibitor n=1 Tax=Handroanthus impetiginosus TaxID=429701 RepID=A0A2G9HZ36_9LAMI|nr:hypothetical protein CDL12_04528 [Handroanthus impetiginosus]